MSLSRFVVLAIASVPFFACGSVVENPGTSSDNINADSSCALATPKDGACATIYDPVCGCDGKTYGNSCEAARAVTSSTPGACADAGTGGDGGACKLASPKAGACATIYDPVCGCDGTTYGNACSAGLVVATWTPGACAVSDAGACKLPSPKSGACPAVYDPVCGCDGKTYGNDCSAGLVITTWAPGACK